MFGSLLFTWLQGAPFYHELHQRAVETLPPGTGKLWLDVGCGPGLVTRLAAIRGYRAKGIDADPRMIKTAQRLAKLHHSAAEFEVGHIAALPYHGADVVSAASLLAVLDDKPSGLNRLWRCVRPGGYLRIVEPTDRMNLNNANQAIARGLPRRRINGLRLWAMVRKNNTVAPGLYTGLAVEQHYVALLDALVGAWVFKKNTAPSPATYY
ncbi:MAG: class I SAM-dependent methyltransferase [Gammaproteobacteria bacterium]|nr:class I SAM-dependent methyltransferase [Gammaproteobacteria bacterium]